MGERELLQAANSHIERTMPIGPRPIDRIIESLHVDAGEFQACLQVLGETRAIPEEDKAAWAAGVVDGFVLGRRGTLIAEGIR